MANFSTKTAVIAALIGNGLIAVTKFVAAMITGSSAMFSEGIHSVADTANQALLLYGLHRSNHQPTSSHPFGYGKESYFWTLVVAIILFALGSGVSFREGMAHLHQQRSFQHVYINYIVLALAALFELGPWWIATKALFRAKSKKSVVETIQQAKDPTVVAVFFEDSAAILGVATAACGIYLSQITGNAIYDSIASLVISGLLAFIAVWLAYESKALLIGESADPQLVADIRYHLQSDPRVLNVMDCLTMHLGPEQILVNVYVDFTDNLDSRGIESAVTEFETQLKALYPQIRYVFIAAKTK